jgi:TolB protein
MNCCDWSRSRSALIALLIASTAGEAQSAEPRRITSDGQRKSAPVFMSADEVVCAIHELPNLVALMRFDLPNGTRERLHAAATAHQFDPAFSADGRFHAYALSASSPQLVLVIQDRREQTEAVYKPREARAVARSPSFAPDASRVVFSLSDVSGHQIASVNVRGEELRLLTQSTGMNVTPAFSPDGRRIAFSSSRDGDFDIYTMTSAGDEVRRLTSSPGLDTRPAWSPDGQQIAFTSNRDGNHEIYLMQADGTRSRRLTDNLAKDSDPVWHPQVRQVLFVSERDGASELYVLDVDDGSPSLPGPTD